MSHQSPDLGPFRENTVVVGDCLKTMRQISGGCIDLIIADPPFFRRVKDSWDNQWDNLGDYLRWSNLWIRESARILKPTGSFYCWAAIEMVPYLYHITRRYMDFRNGLIWKKQRAFGLTRNWMRTRLDILYFVKDKNAPFVFNPQYSTTEKRGSTFGSAKGRFASEAGEQGYKRVTNVWTDIMEVGMGRSPQQMAETRAILRHSTPKPEKAMERIILASSNEGELVADFFVGSGTTLVVADRLNRRFFGCDINPECVQTTSMRLEGLL